MHMSDSRKSEQEYSQQLLMHTASWRTVCSGFTGLTTLLVSAWWHMTPTDTHFTAYFSGQPVGKLA